MLFAFFQPEATAPPSDAEIHRAMAEVLRRPEFQSDPTLEFIRALSERLNRLWAWLGGLYYTNAVLYWILVAACIVLLSLLLTHIVWTVRKAFFVEPGSPHGSDHAAERQRMSATCREEALRRASAGDYTEAIRYLFLSLVYAFDEKGRVSFQKAYTNREYLGLFHDRPQVQQELKQFVDILDDHWYGQRPTDRQRYQECQALYEALK